MATSRDGLLSRRCFESGCQRMALTVTDRYCCSDCKHGWGHGRGCLDRQETFSSRSSRARAEPGHGSNWSSVGARNSRHATVSGASSLPPQQPPTFVRASWRDRWRAAEPVARSLIELVSRSLQQSDRTQPQVRTFVRRLALAFHPDSAGNSASNRECIQFLNSALDELP